MDSWTSPPLVFPPLLVGRKGAFSALLMDVAHDSQGPDDV